MKTIEVLGPGCANCKRLEANAREAVMMAGVEAEVVKVTDYRQISAYGILSTPGLSSTARSSVRAGSRPPATSRSG